MQFKTSTFKLSAILISIGILNACGSSSSDLPADMACTNLNGFTVAKEQIGLPTLGATVTSTTLVAASGVLTEYCQVMGTIAPVDTNKGDPISFRVNLPSNWNTKAMHFGGGGYNGTVVAGTGLAPSAPPDATPPLALGYVTFGSDSGHTSAAGTTFGSRDESLINF